MIGQQLSKILEIGTTILITLDEDSLEIEKIKQLYQQRDEAIHKLDQLALVNDLNLEGKNEIQSLFEQLKNQETKLNKKLLNFVKDKRKALETLETHKKAKESYSQSDDAQLITYKRQIIDLKQG